MITKIVLSWLYKVYMYVSLESKVHRYVQFFLVPRKVGFLVIFKIKKKKVIRLKFGN
jgi:hypothetical protein